ncbi:hypothetical protein ACVWZR_009889 [Bradyrhizobium sp. i1.3.1]
MKPWFGNVEHFGPTGHPGNERSNVIWGSTEQSVAGIGPRFVPGRAEFEVLAATRPLEIETMTLTVFREGKSIEMIRIAFQIEQAREALSRIAEGRMGGHVINEVATEVDLAAVSQRSKIIGAGPKHCSSLQN